LSYASSWGRVACLCAAVFLTSDLPGRAAPEQQDVRYVALARETFDRAFAESPVFATQTGIHAYDRLVDDVSAAAIAAHLRSEKRALAAIGTLDPERLSPEVALDRRLLENFLQDDLLQQGQLEMWKHNPDQYTAIASGSIFGLISRHFAPLETRMRAAVAREQQLPRFFAQAEANLTSVDAATRSVSYDDAGGAVAFFKDDVPAAFAPVKNVVLQARLRAANSRATAALRAYTAYIGRIVPRGTFAIGKDAYAQRLRYEDELSVPLATYLAIGTRALAATRAEFIATSRKIDPARTPEQNFAALAKVHPTPGRLKATAAEDLVRLRTFVIAHRIVTVPADADIEVVDTPAFERAFVSAQMDAPGVLETVATRAYYNVTPVNPAWPAARRAGFLGQFNDFERPLISAHEVYPGHFVNYTIDKHRALSLTRRLLWNSEFGEGWAHYGEQMMVDEGWGNGDPRVRLAQLEEALLRECRFVAGVRLHTQGWSLQRSEELFIHACFQPPAVALEETMRGTQDPMYGYYTLGKLMILKLRAEYKRKLGASYTLQKFHDALLAHGDPPVPLVRPFLLGAADDHQPL